MRNIDPTTAASNSTDTIEKEIETKTGDIIADVVAFAEDDTRLPAYATLDCLTQLHTGVRGVLGRVMTTTGSDQLLGGGSVMALGGGTTTPSNSSGEIAMLAADWGTTEAAARQEMDNLVVPLFASGVSDVQRRARSVAAENIVKAEDGYEVNSSGKLKLETDLEKANNTIRPLQAIIDELSSGSHSRAEITKLLAGMLNVAKGVIPVKNDGTYDGGTTPPAPTAPTPAVITDADVQMAVDIVGKVRGHIEEKGIGRNRHIEFKSNLLEADETRYLRNNL